MTYFRPADHAMGLELQLEELQEQHRRAQVQGRDEDATRLQLEMRDLQAELAATAEMLRPDDAGMEPPHLHDAGKLSTSG